MASVEFDTAEHDRYIAEMDEAYEKRPMADWEDYIYAVSRRNWEGGVGSVLDESIQDVMERTQDNIDRGDSDVVSAVLTGIEIELTNDQLLKIASMASVDANAQEIGRIISQAIVKHIVEEYSVDCEAEGLRCE
jgi:hypothetical protein